MKFSLEISQLSNGEFRAELHTHTPMGVLSTEFAYRALDEYDGGMYGWQLAVLREAAKLLKAQGLGAGGGD